MSSVPDRRYSIDEYLALEESAVTRHEYFGGRIYAMAGASLPHGIIVWNISAALKNQLPDQGCVAVPNDLRVKTTSGLLTYPDLVVVCGKPEMDPVWKNTLLNPAVLVEVLSPTTQDFDRGDKFDHYDTIPSLREYLLVAQDHAQVLQYSRQSNQGKWILSKYEEFDAVVTMASPACQLSLSAIYNQVDFPAERPLLRPHDPLASEP